MTDAGPLHGLRVIELADEKGQFCGKLMADLGADVVKIEPPGGHATRSVGPFLNDVPHRERSLYFWHYNTSKRGVTLDIERPQGKAILRRLAAGADVVLETFAPGHLGSLGLGYETLRTLNPALVHCSLTPFGQTGPWRDYRTSDLLQMAAGGTDGLMRVRRGGRAGRSSHRAGRRQRLAYRQPLRLHRHHGGAAPSRANRRGAAHRRFHPRGVRADDRERGADVHLPGPGGPAAHGAARGAGAFDAHADSHQRRRVRANDGPGWQSQPHAADEGSRNGWTGTGMADDLLDDKYLEWGVFRESEGHISRVVNEFISNMPQEEAWRGGQDRGYPWGAVRTLDDIMGDPHLQDRDFFKRVEHPELGVAFIYPGPAAIFNGSPWRISRRAPLIGEHNGEVYCGELGMSRERLNVLAEAGGYLRGRFSLPHRRAGLKPAPTGWLAAAATSPPS